LKTDENLQQVIASVSSASVKFSAYAEIADKEGYRQVAKLFRAMAETQKVFAINAMRILGELDNTENNLSAAIDIKTYEFTQLYPNFIEQADHDGNPMAQTAYRAAMETTRSHVRILNTALDNIGRNKEVDYWVCQMCGKIESGEMPVGCKTCGAAREKFIRTV
jgi:rubrerythrin